MKIILKYVILLIIGVITSTDAFSQYIFRHLDIVDGLSDNQIRNFTQLPDGRLAVRLVSSLNIYNGSVFEQFYSDRQKDYLWSFNRYQIFKDYCDAEGRLWMKSPGYLSLFDLKTNQFICDIESELKKLGINKKLKNLFIDESKNYWFLTEDNALSFYNITTKVLTVVEAANSFFSEKYGVPEEIAQYKNLYWIVYSGSIIRCWDCSSQEFIHQDTNFIGKISATPGRLSIKTTSTGDLWLIHSNAVCFYNHTEKIWKEVATIKGASNFFTSLDLDKEGNVWVGTSWSGIRRINGQNHKVEIIPRLILTTGDILDNDIQCVFVDNSNGLWIGTLWQGICYYNPTMYKFKLIQTSYSGSRTTNESIRCLLEYNDGNILIGSTHNGLLKYDPASNKIEKALGGLLSDDLILSLYCDRKNRLWVGTYLNGFYCIKGNEIKTYNRSLTNLELFPNQNISRAIYEDPNGRFWVSVSNEGVGELNLNTGKITLLKNRHPEIDFHKVDFNFYPVDNQTFAVFGESGIYYYDTQNDKIFIPEIDAPDNPKFMKAGIRYYCIFKDSRSLEWFGTERGLHIWDETHKRAYTIDTESGLPNNSISAIEEDNNGVYWVSTLNGITKIEIGEKEGKYEFSLVNFNSEDGLQNGKFYDRSSLKTQNGDLYFGGHHGINVFNPNKIIYNQSNIKPIFTAFKLFNSPIKENMLYNGHLILKEPVTNTRQIKLNHNENSITLEFSGLNYVNPSHTYYKYKLENFDKDWTEIVADKQGNATYTGLKPGAYIFKVLAANNDKLWGKELAEMEIVILPPWWASVYAYILYAVLFATIGFCLVKYYIRTNRLKIEQQRKEEMKKQKEELDQLKFRFFTNISHEFRTPLTLIMTPLDTLIKQQNDEQLKNKLTAIYRNAKNLLGLVNQLLDFRKLEMHGEKLKLTHSDLVRFVAYVTETFREQAISRNITLTFESKCEHLFMFFDQDKIHKVLNNLYSNAFKFTPDQGDLFVSIALTEENDVKLVKISVSDTGCGIPEKEITTIFDRFYQSDNKESGLIGSGIGLHLAKEYVSLHNGKIEVNSRINQGSTFMVYIPTNLVGEKNAEIQPDSTDREPVTTTDNCKKLLIVEDNEEFRHFLTEQLSGEFNTIEAGDGEEGEKTALQHLPDLIISDLMMPKLDGLEMCEHLKTNIQTSHIPIILLTARTSDEAKIESYKAGADSYIGKPFNFDVLQARINMLIEQQEKRKELFNKTIEITPSSITTTSLDEKLVQKALQYVEKNMDNTEYSVDELSVDVGLSRSHLYRKLQSITGKTPNEFIQSVRLKRAAQLLINSQYNISEIADFVGYNTIKYFNKHFKEEFGMTPSRYRAEKSHQ